MRAAACAEISSTLDAPRWKPRQWLAARRGISRIVCSVAGRRSWLGRRRSRSARVGRFAHTAACLRGRTAAPTCAGCRAVSRRSRRPAVATARAARQQAHGVARQLLQNATTTPRSSTVAGPRLDRSAWLLHGSSAFSIARRRWPHPIRSKRFVPLRNRPGSIGLPSRIATETPYMSRSWRTPKRFAGTPREARCQQQI
jgi:hypothetical protein